MKIYLDFVFLLNFGFDYILLLVVAIILRRNVSLKRVALGAFFGSISIFALFLNLTSFELFIFKIILSFIMILTTFSYKNFNYFIKNIGYLYMASMVLGGFLYFLNIQFSYANEGIVFYHKGISINVFFLIIFSPIILYTYVKQGLALKNTYSNYYKVNIHIQNKIIKVNAFLDTGNKLVDPITKKPIILINENCIKNIKYNHYLIPINTINNNSLLKCIKIKKIEIEGIGFKEKVILGISPNKIQMEGIDCILQSKLLEG